jgi:hypothetical protein
MLVLILENNNLFFLLKPLEVYVLIRSLMYMYCIIFLCPEPTFLIHLYFYFSF